jgi:valyl-tRNA synthetase
MKTEVTRAAFSGPAESLTRLRSAESDLRGVGRLVGDVEWAEADGPVQVEVTLAGADA